MPKLISCFGVYIERESKSHAHTHTHIGVKLVACQFVPSSLICCVNVIIKVS